MDLLRCEQTALVCTTGLEGLLLCRCCDESLLTATSPFGYEDIVGAAVIKPTSMYTLYHFSLNASVVALSRAAVYPQTMSPKSAGVGQSVEP